MNSDADAEKNGTSASPATARKQRLARPRHAFEQDALRNRGAEATVSLGKLEHVDDLTQLGLDLVDARDVGKRDTRPRLRIVEPRLRAAEPEPEARAELADNEHVRADEDEPWCNAQDEALDEGARQGSRLGVDGDPLREEFPEQVVFGEGRPLSLKLNDGAGAPLGGRLVNGALEVALDRVPARLHVSHVRAIQLSHEDVVRNRDARLGATQQDVHDEDVGDQERDHQHPRRRAPPPFPLRGRLLATVEAFGPPAARRRFGRLPPSRRCFLVLRRVRLCH